MVFGGDNISNIILISIFICYFVIGIRIKNSDIFSPWSVTSGVWIVLLLFLIQFGHLLYPFKGIFQTSLFLWVTTFCLGSIVTFSVTHGRIQIQYAINHKALNLFLWISVIIMPLMMLEVHRALNGNYLNFAHSIRVAASNKEIDFGILKYARTLYLALLFTILWAYPNVKRKVLYYVVIINILFGLLIMEKGTFFAIIIAIVYVLYEKKRLSLKMISIIFAFFIIASFLFNAFRSSSTSYYSFTDFFSIYITSPTKAFETLHVNDSNQFGEHTFPFFYALINALFDCDYNVISKVKDFVFVPVPTNVYTIMQPYYNDWGYLGVILFGLINGCVFGFIYKKSKLGSPVAKCLYLYIVQILVLQFFQENFIVSFSWFIQFSFFCFLLVNRIRWKSISKS